MQENKKFYFQGGLFSDVLSSCTANNASKETVATVVRDCTGTYLRVDSKDSIVCNTAILKPFSGGSAVKASFERIENCPDLME